MPLKSIPKPQQQKSIKDHFAIVTKKEEIVVKETKIYPLFLSKKKVDLEKVQHVSPANNTLIVNSCSNKENWPKPVIPPVPVAATKKNVKKRIPSAPATYLDTIIKSDTQHFYATQKRNRTQKSLANDYQPSKKRYPRRLDRASIEEQMNTHYPELWQQDPCCKALFDNLMHIDRSNNKMLWRDRYRPNAINGLVGYLPDYEYLRDWLNELKINDQRPGPMKESKNSKKRKKEDQEELCHLILLVGGNGIGKTATVYTAAKETGYSIFEINSASRRTGRDITESVGEMTESHLVTFDSHHQQKKRKGEMIILRDTVKPKRAKTIDIAQHFKRMLTVSEPKEKEQATVVQEPAQTQNRTLASFFNKAEEKNRRKKGYKQSLILLEEVDILFEEDKGFWSAVTELCQKSKRPIIMTCNDESLIPFDHLPLQSTLYFDLPEKSSLVPYIQLICYSENYIVKPSDIAYLCELYQYDMRRIIDTLQFWLNETLEDEHFVYQFLFAHVMGFADLLLRPSSADKQGLVLLMDRIKGSSHQIQDLCKKYYFEKILDSKQEEVMGIQGIYKVMETAAFADAWVGLTQKQRHQIYDIDQYDNRDVPNGKDMLCKNATDLDHWELGEVIENSISVMNLLASHSWRNHLSAWSSHWEYLYHQSQDYSRKCFNIIHPVILSCPSTSLFGSLMMIEYMPHIRSMCIYDQGIAGKGRTKRTRKKIRYFSKLSEESREIVLSQCK